MPSQFGDDIETIHSLHVSGHLKAHGLAIRAETPADAGFLRKLYIAGRWEEMAATGWSESAKAAFLGQQFEFQTQHYKSHYLGAVWCIVIQGDVPVGRLYLHQGATDLRIVDISILTDYRNRGIGTAVIQAVFDLARRRRSTVSIHVETFNVNARRLYDRLGFVPAETVGVHYRMDWVPPQLSDSGTARETSSQSP